MLIYNVDNVNRSLEDFTMILVPGLPKKLSRPPKIRFLSFLAHSNSKTKDSQFNLMARLFNWKEDCRGPKFQCNCFFNWYVIWHQSHQNLACSKQFWLIFGKTQSAITIWQMKLKFSGAFFLWRWFKKDDLRKSEVLLMALQKSLMLWYGMILMVFGRLGQFQESTTNHGVEYIHRK